MGAEANQGLGEGCSFSPEAPFLVAWPTKTPDALPRGMGKVRAKGEDQKDQVLKPAQCQAPCQERAGAISAHPIVFLGVLPGRSPVLWARLGQSTHLLISSLSPFRAGGSGGIRSKGNPFLGIAGALTLPGTQLYLESPIPEPAQDLRERVPQPPSPPPSCHRADR